MAPRKYIE
jgi:hypothetical protein